MCTSRTCRLTKRPVQPKIRYGFRLLDKFGRHRFEKNQDSTKHASWNLGPSALMEDWASKTDNGEGGVVDGVVGWKFEATAGKKYVARRSLINRIPTKMPADCTRDFLGAMNDRYDVSLPASVEAAESE